MEMAHRLKFLTYNSTGLGGNKMEYIESLCDTFGIDVVMLQETWLTKKNLPKLSNVHSNFMFCGTSGITDNELLTGRPYGGVAILWRNNLCREVAPVRVSCNRLCAIKITLGDQGGKILLICCYFPCDNFSKSSCSDEFLEVSDAVECMIAENPDCFVVCGGDLNVDVARKNAHDSYYMQLLQRLNIVDIWQAFPEIGRYTYCDHTQQSYSCIDRVAVSANLVPHFKETKVCHDVLNPSKHSPVYFEMELIVNRCQESSQNNAKEQIDWVKVGPYVGDYQRRMNEGLARLVNRSVEQCRDTACTNSDHTQEIDAWCSDLINVILQADKIFPRKKRRKRRTNVCGWNSYVQGYREECLFWGRVWNESSKQDGWLLEKMKAAKRQYHYAVRRVKRRQDELKRAKFAEALADNRSRDFFNELKKMRPKPQSCTSVSGLNDEESIAEHFSTKYANLYNSVTSNEDRLRAVSETIKRNAIECSVLDHVISINDVQRAIKKLKHGKRDGDKGLVSSHLIHSSVDCVTVLANIFTSMYIHGHQAAPLLNATIISIPKDQSKSLADDNNYRGIALCSSIAKVFDLLFLERNSECLKTSNLQFAFKEKFSTSMCTLAVKEVASHFVNRGSDVYAAFLDATKAFDRIRFDCLFESLVDRGVRWLDLRMLLDLYSRQRARASWGSAESRYFRVSNGIRQGSIISPVLFSVYVNELIGRLRSSGSGCWIGDSFFGTFIYADDITVMSPSVRGLDEMIKICEGFCVERGITFNPSKSVCVRFSARKTAHKPTVSLSGTSLKWEETIKHLGNYISSDLSEREEVAHKRGELFGRVNSLLGNFAGMHHSVLSKLFKTQCLHLYGCQSWRLNDRHVKSFQTAVNRCIRRILGLHPQTHCNLLPLLIKTNPVIEQMCQRVIKMKESMMKIGGEIELLCNICSNDSVSITGSNNLFIENFVEEEVNDDVVCIAQAILDLLDGVEIFDHVESEEFVDTLAIS